MSINYWIFIAYHSHSFECVTMGRIQENTIQWSTMSVVQICQRLWDQLCLHHQDPCSTRSRVHLRRIKAKHSNLWNPPTNLIGSWPTTKPALWAQKWGILDFESNEDPNDGASLSLCNFGVLEPPDTAAGLRQCCWAFLPWKITTYLMVRMSWSSAQDSQLMCWRPQIQCFIWQVPWLRFLCGFPQVLQATAKMVPQIRPQLLFSLTSPGHYATRSVINQPEMNK